MKIQELLNDFYKIQKQYQTKGNSFNFFQFIEDKFWKITETKHSRILAFFLNPEETHGQGGTFLKLFLDKLEIDTTNFNQKEWRVYVERNNIDILLQCKTISIVIENKSNGAENQNSCIAIGIVPFTNFIIKTFKKLMIKTSREYYIYLMDGGMTANQQNKLKNVLNIFLLMSILKNLMKISSLLGHTQKK